MITTKAGPGGNGPDGSAFPYNNGRPGRGGGTAVAFATDANTGRTTLVGSLAVAGDGGQGGDGANSSKTPGNAAAGSLGGNAYASAITTHVAAASATAVGRIGGASGRPGALLTGVVAGLGANGGQGGLAA